MTPTEIATILEARPAGKGLVFQLPRRSTEPAMFSTVNPEKPRNKELS